MSMRQLTAFGRFWWDFVIGDTPEVTAGVVVALVIAALLSGHRVAAVLLVPFVVLVVLSASVWRGRRR